ncbi:trans-aconitate methyltransferase [Intrasporangium oryzae NRRL B-24470]|uniref:Trans-aconitate methyltransferase n=1 Tax=Intrasporangium oryzae NRRL B-24470 TaxID=1386089 RepID=W9G8T0_9MICO|nr:class I SAM-dependent methyltransferase [Intrasporangium oryzae]EWT02581.1 trans-aconitate methyltransferase [Intrasporangium oryzae NRRL B-24470]
MTVEAVRVSPAWLDLRERADAEARATDLVEHLRPHLRGGPLVVHDLGCGTGSMGRWLAPRLGGAQHWVLHDWDADLLARATVDPPRASAGGAGVTVETRQCDITSLDPCELAGASLVTASALLDLMTSSELDRFVALCSSPGCPVLVTLSVVGRVELAPAEPLDELVAIAFNDHQRRTTQGRRLLGPDAMDVAVDSFGRLGAEVVVRESPWRLGPGESELAIEWLAGWVGAACEQNPELAGLSADYLQRRGAEAVAGRLRVTVHHRDLLAVFR